MQPSTFLLFSSAISRIHRGDLMRLANTAGLWPKVEKQCVFLQQKSVISYLGAILWFVVSLIFQSFQRKHWWPLDHCTHIKTVSWEIFQVSALEELSQRIDLFQRNSRPAVSVLIPIVCFGASGGFCKITCRCFGWQLITLQLSPKLQ